MKQTFFMSSSFRGIFSYEEFVYIVYFLELNHKAFYFDINLRNLKTKLSKFSIRHRKVHISTLIDKLSSSLSPESPVSYLQKCALVEPSAARSSSQNFRALNTNTVYNNQMKCQNFYVNFIYQVVLHLLHINLDTHNTPLLARSVERQILDNIIIKKSYPVP